MRYLLTLGMFLLGLCYQAAPTLAQPTDQDQIKYIKQRFVEVNVLCQDISPIVHQSDTLNGGQPAEFKEWFKDGSLIKFQVTLFKGNDKTISDYYFGQDGLIFAFYQDHLTDENNRQFVHENRYYFKDEQTLIKWLDEDKNNVPGDSDAFAQKEGDIWGDMHSWSEMVFMVFGNDERYNAVNQTYNIEPKAFYGIVLNAKISSSSDRLEKGTLSTGDGDFDVFYIIGASGERLGYLMPHRHDEEKVGTIVITTPQASTEYGLKVGMTFGEIMRKFESFEVHGSELESRTYAIVEEYALLLDAYHTEHNLDPSLIDKQAKVKEISISSR
ncbi:MAG: hypothetical protein AAFX87_13860 [Bacteroidota bacterium]